MTRHAFVAGARLLLCALGLWATMPAWAHKASDSYLTLQVSGASVTGQWDIALRDLEFAIGLDANEDGEITWGELRARHGEIARYALARLSLQGDGADCPLRAGEQQVDRHSDGAYTVLHFVADCPRTTQALQVEYRLFADTDPQHRGLLNLRTAADAAVRSAVFSPQAARQRFELARPNWWAQFIDYARDGVWHIWIGYDHILFLLSLLLPAVLHWQRPRWQPVGGFREAFVDVLKIVTAFTVAHSITLSLATLGVLSLPSRWVEASIAASVVLAALNNLFSVVHGRRWLVAFAFGLVHGFGFASVLADLGLPQASLALALVGFNLGVEAGQLAIVAVFLPLAFWLRHGWFYQRLVFRGGSMLIVLIASAWFAERAFDLKLMPF